MLEKWWKTTISYGNFGNISRIFSLWNFGKWTGCTNPSGFHHRGVQRDFREWTRTSEGPLGSKLVCWLLEVVGPELFGDPIWSVIFCRWSTSSLLIWLLVGVPFFCGVASWLIGWLVLCVVFPGARDVYEWYNVHGKSHIKKADHWCSIVFHASRIFTDR